MTRGSVIASLPHEIETRRRRSKYGAVRTQLDGHSFASKREAMRYAALKLEQMAGRIRNLELQPRYPLIVNGDNCGTYVGDFKYFRGDETICEDVKGVKTDLYRLKKKLVWAIYRVKVVEVA